jgi:hypothetical protein
MLTILVQRQRDTNEKLRGVRNANQAIEENLSTWAESRPRSPRVSASQSFVLLNVVFFGGWMVINLMFPPRSSSTPRSVRTGGIHLLGRGVIHLPVRARLREPAGAATASAQTWIIR